MLDMKKKKKKSKSFCEGMSFLYGVSLSIIVNVSVVYACRASLAMIPHLVASVIGGMNNV